jgi:glutamyl-Q tRNA(Asp) synthetase
VRVIIDPSLERSIFDDAIFGRQEQNLIQKVGDFVIKRRDGLISYQLAVTIDDSAQGITDIVRGADLLNSTHRQLFLQRILQLPQPKYAHITVATSDDNLKLSKQNFASELPYGRESENLFVALNWLNQNPPNDLRFLSPGKIMEWSVENWDRASLLPELARHAPPDFY